MDGWGRKAEISLAWGKPLGFPPSTLLPPRARGALRPPVPLARSKALCTSISPRFQRESALPYFHKEDWKLPPNPPIHFFLRGRWPWLRPPVAHGAGEPGGLETERGRRLAQSSLGCNKLKQKQLPLSKSPVPAPEHNCTAGGFKRRSLLFNTGLQQIDSVTAPSVRDLNPPLIDMTYRNGFFGYLSSYCVLRKL